MLHELFFTFLKIGFFVFGGGYVIVPLLQEEVVFKNHWLTQKEFLDSLTIGQITPGPVTITATFIGYKIGALGGAILATLGIFGPSLIIMGVLSKIYQHFEDNLYIKSAFRGILLAVIGLILATAVTLGKGILINIPSWFILILGFIAGYKFKIDYIFILLTCGLLGIIFFYS